ncbi:MAG: phosphate acyltransferase PlsX [Verrucomicrobiae bacterium]|nr:phosphate acyltransferase PlsX [Verrucomicrobiae bacterium]
MKIAIDAMGGDKAPASVVDGVAQALRNEEGEKSFQRIERIYLVGKPDAIEAELKKLQFSDSRIEIVPATEVVAMDESPVQAVRRKKGSSMAIAIDLVKQGKADAILSAGNTGALMVGSHLKLRTLEGVDRPGLSALLPSPNNIFVLVDVGGNLEPRPSNLVQYAVMASVYSREILGYAKPRVGLISIGTEDIKGNDVSLETFRLLKQVDINFIGNIDCHELFSNVADVVVTDAFVGNAILKTCESTARTLFYWLREEIYKSPRRRLGGLLAKPALKAIHKRLDADEYGGAMFFGLNGICVKAHGASSARAIRNALRVACESVGHKMNDQIIAEIRKANEKIKSAQSQEPALEATH